MYMNKRTPSFFNELLHTHTYSLKLIKIRKKKKTKMPFHLPVGVTIFTHMKGLNNRRILPTQNIRLRNYVRGMYVLCRQYPSIVLFVSHN